MVLKLPRDFAKKIGEVLCVQDQGVDALFEFSETKEGYFIAQLKPKQFLDKAQFRTMCALARDLGGEGYIEGAKAWKIPGPFVKKSSEVPLVPETDFLASPKVPGNAIPTVPLGDKNKWPFLMLPVKSLLSMPFQCREGIGEGEKFEELVESVRLLGVLHPIIVRQKDSGSFEIVAGERRVAACRKLGIAEIPAIVRAMSDQEAYEVQLVENVQREDLSDMEKARMLDMMITQFGYTQEALAKKLGKGQPWVSRHLQMLKLSDYAPGHNVEIGKITEKQAREILAAPEEKREEILDKAREEGALPSARTMEEIRKSTISVSCARCGESIQGTPVCLGGNKFYDAECAEAVVAEAKTGHEQSIEPGTGGALRTKEVEKEEAEEVEKRGKVEEKSSKREALKAVQIGEFECTECHQRFLIDHMPNGKHKLRLIREGEEK
ncbi:ParB/RepB/Spo0J family partition protein [Candidatus Bathyarchaeota archaeon]|nr:ParB/RepB/Spo0J family partition protein [Candidatus Bathyarchaeota archaeon]